MLEKLKYILWYGLRSLIKPWVLIENGAAAELFMALHWTTIWLLKHDWILSKIHGSNQSWDQVYNKHIKDIKQALDRFQEERNQRE